MISDELLKRSMTGAVLLLTIIILVSAGPYSFLILILLINTGGLYEFYVLLTGSRRSARNLATILLAQSVLVVLFLVLNRLCNPIFILLFIPLTFLLFVAELYLKEANPIQSLATRFLGILCITIPLCFFLISAYLPLTFEYNSKVILGYFFLLWANDTGAYVIGKVVGRHKLFARISPNKTWEGTAGGATWCLAVAYLSARFDDISLTHWIVIAIIVIITGTYGDLLKSMLKRSLHVKDTGTILPGHGGILDRFDSLLGSAPFVCAYLIIIEYV